MKDVIITYGADGTPYESITVRDLTVATASGKEDLVLFPEDVLEFKDNGDIRITTPTIEGERVFRAGRIDWYSWSSRQHRRKVEEEKPSNA